MKKLKKGRVVAEALIIVLLVAIVSIIKISHIDKYAGLVKINNASLASVSTKLSANISDLSAENEIYTGGYDEVEYNIKYRLSAGANRDVIINAKVDDNNEYASFKEATGENITSVLSANRKEITITISNVPSDVEINSVLTMVIENAPKGYTVSPVVRIKESTSENYTGVTVKPVTVNTNSLQGTVIDEDGEIIPNILVSLKKGNEIIKETYTNSNGIYTFSDIVPDTYSVIINEETLENLEIGNLYINDANILNLIAKKVTPYKIETNKYITKVELNNLGSSKDYIYDDVELAQIPVKRVNDLHGKIYYKITVQNTGEKAGIISSVKDELPDGLSFDEKLNSGFELKNGIIYDRNLEGVELKAGEQIIDTLILTINNTDIAKTYINQVNAKGELYEHVVYLLNGKLYKSLDVLEGEKIDKLEVSNNNFSGWYTDEKLTNKYNFDLPVEKDLILYGVTAKKHTVIFNDKHPETGDVEKYDEQKVPNGEPVTKPSPDPSKTGYTFCGWDKDDNTHWDFNTPVTEDLTLTSCYEINEYKVDFYDNSMTNGNSYQLISTLTKVYKSTLSNSEAPDLSNAWEGHNFLKWTTDPEGQHAYDFTSKIIGNLKLYAQYTLQDRLFIFNDENRITEKTVDYGSTVEPISDKGKEGHTFKYWSLSLDGEPFDFPNTPIYQTTTVYAVYQINVYPVIFNDTDPWTDVTTEYDRQDVPHGGNAVEPTEPTKEGHTFCGWKLNGNTYDFTTAVTEPITLTSCYIKNKVTVTFMDGDNQYEQKQIDYGSQVTDTATHPTKEHYIFKYWSEDNINGFDYSTIIKSDKTLYSVYEEVAAPTITHTPLYWTNDKVLVTITSSNPNYSIVYKVDDGSYQDYSAPFELSANGTITAKCVSGDAESVIATHEVTNIDKLNPTIGDITPTPTQNSITLTGTMIDNQSGVQVINVYNNNVLVGTTNGTPVDLDLRDYTKSKMMNVVISGLEIDTEYTFKVQVYDGAGNVSEDNITARTGQPDIICQIISVDGVDLNEEDYVPFSLLSLAIEDSRCDSKCTIQMLKNTNESVEILDTQDITLDLNGKTVAGVLPGYTVSNEGLFTLIDHAQTPGGLVNTTGIAVMNNSGAKFTMGEGSSDAPSGSETRVVSTTVPYVFGETYGVYTEHGAEFAFFDGKIKSTSGVQGEVTETEYSYNATSGTEDGYETETLAQLDDPEARINKSVYYSNVANAVGDASQGGTSEVVDTPTTFLSGFSHREGEETETYTTSSGFKFEYDAENDTLTSTNNYYGSVAFTETIVDLTDYADDQLLEFMFNVTNSSDGTRGLPTFYVYELDNNFRETSSMYKIYGFDKYQYRQGTDFTSVGYKLSKGKRYKVKIAFTQEMHMEPAYYLNDETRYDSSYVQPAMATSKLIITSGTLKSAAETVTEYDQIDSNINLNVFYYDETTDTIRSGNTLKKQDDSMARYAYSNMELDLTNKEGSYEVSIDAILEGGGTSSSYGKIYISETPLIPHSKYDGSDVVFYQYAYGRNNYISYSNSSNPITEEEILDFYGYPRMFYSLGPQGGTQVLQGGKKYYINLYYDQGSTYSDGTIPSQAEYEQYNIDNQFIIRSIKVVKVGESEPIDIPSSLVGNAFDTDAKITFYDNQEYYGKMNSNANEYYDSYLKIDLTDSTKDKVLEVDQHYYYYNYVAMYITSNNKGLTTDYINANKDKMLVYKDDYNIQTYPYINGQYPGNYGGYKTNYVFEKGNVYYVHFNMQLGFSNRYSYQGEYYTCENSYYCGAMLKGLTLKDVEETVYNFGKYPVNEGTVSYDELPEDTNSISLKNSDSVVLNNRVKGYVFDENTKMYTLAEPLNYYEIADFVTEIDLTSATAPRTYYFKNNYSNGSSNSFYTVDQIYPMKYNWYGSTTWSFPYTYVSSNTYFSLEPGHVYYFRHFIYNYSSSPSTDSFSLNPVDGEKTKEYIEGNNLITFNEDVDEIQILKNIDLKDSIVIDQNKETILDLNGYTISSNLSTPIINNSGKLTITDSDYLSQTGDNKVHNGKIQGNAGNLIVNQQNASLTIEGVVINVNGAYIGVSNNGYLNFTSGKDSKIYVNPRNAYGIYNYRTGTIDDSYSGLEVVLNYNNQSEYNYALYTSLEKDHINTGIRNEGYINAGGLKISGKNGRGYWGYGENSIAIFRTANFDVPINSMDTQSSDYFGTDYRYRYWRGSNLYEITDVTVYMDYDSTVSFMDGSFVGHRTRMWSSSTSLFAHATSFDYLLTSNGSKLYLNSGSSANNAELHGESTFNSGGIVKNTLDNYGTAYFNSTGVYSASDSGIINNHENGAINAINYTGKQFNNYDDGTIVLKQSNGKHIINRGKEITLERATINNTDTSFNEAIENSSVLNLNESNTITDVNKYAIKMIPYSSTRTVEFYNRKSVRKTYTEYTYKQAVLNIGDKVAEGQYSYNTIKGKERGVTGPCYQASGRKYITDTLKDTKFIQYPNGEKEPIIQSNYDQNVCEVNMYSGYITNTEDPNGINGGISIPINKTSNDEYTYWSNGLYVYPKALAIEQNLTREVASINGTNYISLQDAIDSITTNDPVTINVHWYFDVGTTIIPEGRNITLNFDSDTNSFAYSQPGAIENHGNLTIHGDGGIYLYSKHFIDNRGTLLIDGGNFNNLWVWTAIEKSAVKNSGTATITGGIFRDVDIYNTGNLTVTNGEFAGSMFYGNGSNSLTTIKGGWIYGTSAVSTYFDYLISDSTANVNNSWRHVFELNNGATAVIDGLSTDTETRYEHFRPIAHLSNSTIEFKDGKIAAQVSDDPIRYIAADNNSNVIFDDGTYENIHINLDSSTLTVNGGTLTGYKALNGSSGQNLVYIHGTKPIVNIRSGNLSANNNVIGISDFKKPDDPNEQFSYVINIGIRGDRDENNNIICSKTSPSLVGTSKAIAKYGIGSGNGYIGFFDGIAKAPTQPPIDTDIDEIEEDYEIISGTESVGGSTYSTQYLDQRDLVKNTTTGEIYKTFQKAFNEATNGDILETLRDYTNTKNSIEIVIPNTSNFTLKVKHIITVNNTKFITNNGNATFIGFNGIDSNNAYCNIDNDDCYKGSIVSNVTGTIIENNGTLTLDDLSISNIKATNNSSGKMFINNENATLNILGSQFETVQHTIIENDGNLVIDKNSRGTSSCYNSTIFKTNYVAGTQSTICNMKSTPINNNGTATINYMTFNADDYCRLIANYGDMEINHSTLNQTSNSYNPSVSEYNDEDTPIWTFEHSTLDIKNSNILYVPVKATAEYGRYSNVYNFNENYYIWSRGSDRVSIENSKIDTSIYGLLYSSVGGTIINISDSDIHNDSFGILYQNNNKITLTNNNIETEDSVVDVTRYSGGWYGREFEYNYGLGGYTESATRLSTIDINGGTYISHNSIKQFDKSYTPMSITYKTLCSNGTMNNITNDISERTYRMSSEINGYSYDQYIDLYSNTITSAGKLNIKDATITMEERDKYYLDIQYKNDLNVKILGTPYYTTASYLSSAMFGAVVGFDEINIDNSTITSNDSYISAIKTQSDNSIITLGKKDSNYNIDSPVITASQSNNPIVGKVKFYDGIISTTSDNSMGETITFLDQETNYYITGTSKTRFLTQNKIIKNITKDVEYSSIQDAIDAASNNDELKLLINYYPSDNTSYVIDGKNLTIDSNGINLYNTIELINSANVTAYDSQIANSSNSYINFDVTNSTLNLQNSRGKTYARSNAIVNCTGFVPHDLYGYDNAVINVNDVYDSNTYVGLTAHMYNNSIININGSKIYGIYLYDNSNYTVTDSQDVSSYIYYLNECTSRNLTINSGIYSSINIYNNDDNLNKNTTIENITVYTVNMNSGGTLTLNSITSNGYINHHIGTLYANNITAGTLELRNEVRKDLYAYINGGSYSNINNSGNNWDDDPHASYLYLDNGVTVSREVRCSGYSECHIIDATAKDFYNWAYAGKEKKPTMYLGVKDGNVSTTTPSATNSNGVALINDGDGYVYFYDGIVTGGGGYSAISGLINDVEDNYKISVVQDTENNTESAYLTAISDNDPRVAMVNGINYTSLQQAINKSVQNKVNGVCPNITIYLNIELDADLTIESGNTVNIISNGFSISTNGYNVPDTILLDGEPLANIENGGDIVNGIKGMLGIEKNTKNVLVYEMSDGSALSTESHYRLYSYTDGEYDLVTMEKGEEVARYNPGKGVTNMKPIKGRLYLTDLEPGNYKVSDDNGSELTFTINEDGTLSGHVKEYIPSDSKIEATGIAKLVITIQTGIRRVNYMLIAISLIAVLSIMFVLKRRSQNNKNLV